MIAQATVKVPERVRFGNESVHPWISIQSLFRGSSSHGLTFDFEIRGEIAKGFTYRFRK